MQEGTLQIQAPQFQASESDFEVQYHEPDWLQVGEVSICTRCGVLSQYPAVTA